MNIIGFLKSEFLIPPKRLGGQKTAQHLVAAVLQDNADIMYKCKKKFLFMAAYCYGGVL